MAQHVTAQHSMAANVHFHHNQDHTKKQQGPDHAPAATWHQPPASCKCWAPDTRILHSELFSSPPPSPPHTHTLFLSKMNLMPLFAASSAPTASPASSRSSARPIMAVTTGAPAARPLAVQHNGRRGEGMGGSEEGGRGKDEQSSQLGPSWPPPQAHPLLGPWLFVYK